MNHVSMQKQAHIFNLLNYSSFGACIYTAMTKKKKKNSDFL